MPMLPLMIVQAGLETTAGLAVPATRLVDMEPGQATLKFEQELITVTRAGSLATGHFAYAGGYQPTIEFKNLPVSYTDLPWFANFFTAPDETGSGASTDKTYTNTPSDTADVAKRGTFEVGGRDTWVTDFKISGCAGKSFGLKWDRKGLWRMDATFVGMALTKATKTGALTARTVKHIVGAGTKTYVDTSTLGSTIVTARLLTGEFLDEEEMTPQYTLDGTTGDAYAPGSITLTGNRKVSCKLKILFTSAGEWDAFRAATIQKVRIKQVGPVLGTSFWSVILDIVGVWETYDFDDEGGALTASLSLTALYDSTLGADWQLITVNDQTTLA